jgi:ceramide synthetase
MRVLFAFNLRHVVHGPHQERLCRHVYTSLFDHSSHKSFICMQVKYLINLNFIDCFKLIDFFERYHKIGMLVIFVHDITDILLEFSKSNHYLIHRNGKFNVINDILSKIGLICFAVSWYLLQKKSI